MDSKKKILIADESQALLSAILQANGASSYQIETATKASECLKKCDHFDPDLLIVDLMLPEMHGIEILKSVKKKSKVAVFILSSNPMIQNHDTALMEGASYFLPKPFDIELLFNLIGLFFSGRLKPNRFEEPLATVEKKDAFIPLRHAPSSFFRFWGTRGSSPVSGREYLRYGGNTPCLQVRSGDDMIIIDAGTGIRPLGKHLLDSPFKNLHIFLGHTHWDHIAGFPFFAPLYQKEFEIHIWSPVSYTQSTQDLFNEKLSYSFFPVQLKDIAARIFFHDLRDTDTFSLGKIHIECSYAYHPGPTMCFKVKVGSFMIGYVTDNEFLMNYHGDPKEIDRNHPLVQPYDRFLNFLEGCNVLVHEAQYFPSEYIDKVGWGHSSISNAALVAKFTQAREWLITHHDPKHTDDDLIKKFHYHRDIVDYLDLKCVTRIAYDDLIIPI